MIYIRTTEYKNRNTDQRLQLKQPSSFCIVAKEKEKGCGPGLQPAECEKYGKGKVHL